MRRGSGLLGGLILIALGLLFFFHSSNWASWEVWAGLARLWPLLLIFIGATLLFGGTALWRLAVLALAVAAVALLWVQLTASGPVQTVHIDERAPSGVRSVAYHIGLGGGTLELAADRRAGTLLAGDIETFGPIAPEIQTHGDAVDVALDEGRLGALGRNWRADWDLTLSPDLPADVDIDAGAAKLTLDLRQVRLQRLRLSTGASKVDVQLGGQVGVVRLDFSMAAADLELALPEDVAVEIENNGVLMGQNFAEAGLVRDGDTWRSPGYDQAKRRVEIHLSAAASRIRLARPSDQASAPVAASSQPGAPDQAPARPPVSAVTSL